MSYVVIKYIRLSIEDAKTESLSIENQRLILDSYIAAMDEPDIEVMELVDNGYTGTNFERPAVQELLELVRVGKANCIIVKDFSRFGRNAIETGYFLQRVFPLFRVRFISVSDSFDSAEHEGDTGGLGIAFKLLLSERYSRDLSKKIKASKQAKARSGEYVTKNCAFGFKKVGKRLEIDEPAAETVRLIFELYSNGHSLAKVVARLYEDKHPSPSEYKRGANNQTCIWNKSAILDILRDEQYIGTYTAGKTRKPDVGSGKVVQVDKSEWTMFPNHHPAIIGKELFDAAHEKINQKGEPLRRRETTTSDRYSSIERPLKGKVVCGCCGHNMRLSNTRNAVFQCRYTFNAPGEPCHRLRIADSELMSALFETIREQAQAAMNTDSFDMHSRSESELARLVADNKKAKQMLYERYVHKEISAEEYKAAKVALDAEIERLNHAHAALQAENEKKTAALKTGGRLRELTEEVFHANKLSKPLVDLLIDEVKVFPGERIEIRWKLPAFQDAAVG